MSIRRHQQLKQQHPVVNVHQTATSNRQQPLSCNVHLMATATRTATSSCHCLRSSCQHPMTMYIQRQRPTNCNVQSSTSIWQQQWMSLNIHRLNTKKFKIWICNTQQNSIFEFAVTVVILNLPSPVSYHTQGGSIKIWNFYLYNQKQPIKIWNLISSLPQFKFWLAVFPRASIDHTQGEHVEISNFKFATDYTQGNSKFEFAVARVLECEQSIELVQG